MHRLRHDEMASWNGMPPSIAAFEHGWFGKSRDDVLKGNVLAARLGNFLPPPDRGAFQADLNANCDRFLERIRSLLRVPSHAPAIEFAPDD